MKPTINLPITTFSLLTLLTLTTAAPTSQPSTLHRRGAPGGAYFCSGENWSGDCWWYPPPVPFEYPWTCWNFLPEWAIFESVGPDPGASIALYDQENCKGEDLPLDTPGTNHLSGFGWPKGRAKSALVWIAEDDVNDDLG
ncbi:hypothetical protein LTR37_009099 [Vermiconidia calcicola]|uniref:Uncharacterized protein n=1 Tax=Vermiconidia calcicola TaxID=1690605 RepID=A0ACC3N9V3_9PEZI|nr:hypothetical protein LTR37_009099 [Vermiconidia calcicola]